LLEKLLHWSLAFSVTSVWFYFENGDAPHRYVGYFAFAVALLQQVFVLFKKKQSEHKLVSDHPVAAFLVHNLIWILVGALAVTGWMMSLDRFWGEDWLEQLHNALSWALMAFVTLHLIGVLRDAYKFKRATWLQMITHIPSPKGE
jgi:cytochrome b